jgi:hypothetical protein
MTSFRITSDIPTSLRVDWARFPVLWWRDVAVSVAEPVELSMLDTFTVETARTLGRLTQEAFQEFTGLPAQVFAAMARRLHTMGLLRWVNDALYPEGARTEVEAPTMVSVVREETLDFLFLPETDELIAVTDGLEDFERAWPRRPQSAFAPLPQALHRTTRNELLGSRIIEGRVIGLPGTVIGLVVGVADEPLSAMAGAAPEPPVPVCPVLECSADIRWDGPDAVVSLEVKARRGGGAETTTVTLPSAPRLLAQWTRVGEHLGRPEHRSTVTRLVTDADTPAKVTRMPGGGWTVVVGGIVATNLSQGRSLVEPVGVTVVDQQATVSQPVHMVPADSVAERLFAVDTLVAALLADPARVVEAMVERADEVVMAGGTEVLWRRARKLGHFWVTHRLRESKDFDYA